MQVSKEDGWSLILVPAADYTVGGAYRILTNRNSPPDCKFAYLLIMRGKMSFRKFWCLFGDFFGIDRQLWGIYPEDGLFITMLNFVLLVVVCKKHKIFFF